MNTEELRRNLFSSFLRATLRVELEERAPVVTDEGVLRGASPVVTDEGFRQGFTILPREENLPPAVVAPVSDPVPPWVRLSRRKR